jgi:hypothetical protein
MSWTGLISKFVKLDRTIADLDGIEHRTYDSYYCLIDDADRAVLIKC